MPGATGRRTRRPVSSATTAQVSEYRDLWHQDRSSQGRHDPGDLDFVFTQSTVVAEVFADGAVPAGDAAGVGEDAEVAHSSEEGFGRWGGVVIAAGDHVADELDVGEAFELSGDGLLGFGFRAGLEVGEAVAGGAGHGDELAGGVAAEVFA